jgi:hypothetical protein
MLKRQQFMIAALLALALGTPASKAQTPAQKAAPAAVPAAAAAAPDPGIEARRKENAEKLARAVAEEERRAAAIKAYEQEQAEQQTRLAREKEVRDAHRARATYESQCEFKAVMSDEDIARCRSVFRN